MIKFNDSFLKMNKVKIFKLQVKILNISLIFQLLIVQLFFCILMILNIMLKCYIILND